MDEYKIQVPKEHYNNSYDNLERFISYFYQIKSALDTKAKEILEIGIGNGTVSDYLKKTGIKVTTCDFDKELKPDVVADIRKLPFADKSMDTVLAFEILEHIPFEDLPKALKELKRVSRKNVIVSVPYSCASIELVSRISCCFMSKLIQFAIRIPYFFVGIKMGGRNKEHYWEIGRRKYSKFRVRRELRKYFKIEKEFQPIFNSYHLFFVLSKK